MSETSEIPNKIKAILRDEGVSAQCYKRLKDAWPEVPESEVAAARKELPEEKKILDRFLEGYVTLKDAERAMIMAATKDAYSRHDIQVAANRLGMATTTLYRKLKQYRLNSVDDSQAVILKKRIEWMSAEADRLEKLLPPVEQS